MTIENIENIRIVLLSFISGGLYSLILLMVGAGVGYSIAKMKNEK